MYAKEIKHKGRIYEVTVDDCDKHLLQQYSWYINNEGHGILYVRRSDKPLYLSREIMKPPKGMIVDHEDGNTMNNQRYNLRICTSAENSRNRRKTSSPTSSKYKGVSWRSAEGLWVAAIVVDGRTISIGRFDDEKEAAIAYNNAAKKYHGEFSNLNEVPQSGMLFLQSFK